MRSFSRFCSVALFLCCSFALRAPASHAWGPKGHQWIADKAVECLEGDLKTFFAKHRQYIVEHSMDPDYRKEQDPGEGVRHFIDLDRYGRFPFRQFDLSYDKLVLKAGKETVDKNGTVLWSAEQTFENLVQAFKARDQQKILLYTTDLAHYVGDLHQPFHAVENYNGQFTGQHGIHFRFEDDLLNLYIDKIQFFPSRPSDLGPVLTALYDMALDSFMWVDNILVADQKVAGALSIDRKNLPREGRKIVYPEAYFPLLFKEVDKIIERRLNQSAHALASLWWMAWQKAGRTPETR